MQFQGFFVGQDKKMQLKNKKKTKVREGCLDEVFFTNNFHLQAVKIISCLLPNQIHIFLITRFF